MTLVQKIKMLCDLEGTTFAALERELDFGSGSIRKWDNAVPSGDRLAKVAKRFRVSTDYLLGLEDDNSNVSDGAFFRLKKGLEPLGLSEEDADYLINAYKLHKEFNKKGDK
ncbi:hypothetical protein ACRQV7_02965 [Caproiciproducens sp. R2]|uniref:hypothetical protein n=1 Tax=Caproiciproducens sp. R2 TaxID=3435187 RepID=UPI0040333D27